MRIRIFILMLMLAIFTNTAHGFQNTDENQQTLSSGNNAFAFDLYHTLAAQESGNLIFSPYSLSQALAMTYAGAQGSTEQQMATVLHFDLPQETLHPTFSAPQANLTAPPTSQSAVNSFFRLSIANALWGQQSYPFHPEYMALLAENYGSEMNLLNFADSALATQTINNWVAEQTEDRITEIIPPDLITEMTRFVLTNAIYFYARWLNQFSAEITEPAPFILLDGNQITAPLMFQESFFPYTEGFIGGAKFQAVELPYLPVTMSMIILLPAADQFEAFESSLHSDSFETLTEFLSDNEYLALTMPRFEFEFEASLKDTLSAMGMPDAFSEGSADFSGMATLAGDSRIFISHVLHKAFVKVDETGTEAAAVTAVAGTETGGGGLPPEPIEFRADHPFIFFIYDRATGSILFMGRVLNPVG